MGGNDIKIKKAQERRLRRGVRCGVPGSARFASSDWRRRRAIVPYRTGTGNQISNTHPVITDRQTETESEQEICPGLLLLTS